MNEILYNTKYLQLKRTKTTSGGDWVYAHRPNADNVVVILPIFEDKVLFLIENRPPLEAEGRGKYSVALPAGLVGDERIGETTEEAIKSELLEEAGLISDKIEIKARTVASSSGCVSETCTIAFAYIKNQLPVQKPVDDNGIIKDRIWVEKQNIRKWLKEKEDEGFVLTGQTLGALFYLFSEDNI